MIKKMCIAVLFLLIFVPFSLSQELMTIAPGQAGTAGDSLSVGLEGRVSMDFENASLKDILKAFSLQTGANFVASDVIEDKIITVYLKDVTMEEALTSILQANVLTYEKQMGDVYLIKPAGTEAIKTETRVFKLEYLPVYDMVLSKDGSDDGLASVTPGGTGIIDAVTSVLSPYGKMVSDRRSNALIITDIPENFENIERTIKGLDTQPLQIMIQAEIIETSTTSIKKIGMEYGSEDNFLSLQFGQDADGNGTNMSSDYGPPFMENLVKTLFGSSSITGTGAVTYGTLTVGAHQLLLKLFASDSDTKLLARPRVLTINNEPALIKVSQDTAIGTSTVSVTQTGETVKEAERYETGVILSVLPQVNGNGDIFMQIEPMVASVITSTFKPDDYMDPTIKSSSSTVMVRDGETVAISGLIKTNNVETLRKVPFLADIPIIGEPFKSRSKRVDDTEVIIFVTPTVINQYPSDVEKNMAKKTVKPALEEKADPRKEMIKRILEQYKKKGE